MISLTMPWRSTSALILCMMQDPSKESQYDQSHDIIQEYVKLHPDVAAKFKKVRLGALP